VRTRQSTPCAGYAPRGGASLVFEEGGVALDERLLVVGDIVGGEDRIRSAGRDAGATIDALSGIDKKLSGLFEAGLILLGMNAIGGADIDAEGILDAGISDYVGHDEENLRYKIQRSGSARFSV
jgi:hypothetical protein